MTHVTEGQSELLRRLSLAHRPSRCRWRHSALNRGTEQLLSTQLPMVLSFPLQIPRTERVTVSPVPVLLLPQAMSHNR